MFVRFPAGVDCGGGKAKPVRVLSSPASSKFVYPLPLAGFRRLQQHYRLLREPYHFRSFGSAQGLLAGKQSGVPNTVGYDCWHITVSLTSSLSAPPYWLLHLASLTRFGTAVATRQEGSRQSQKVGQENHLLEFARRGLKPE